MNNPAYDYSVIDSFMPQNVSEIWVCRNYHQSCLGGLDIDLIPNFDLDKAVERLTGGRSNGSRVFDGDQNYSCYCKRSVNFHSTVSLFIKVPPYVAQITYGGILMIEELFHAEYNKD